MLQAAAGIAAAAGAFKLVQYSYKSLRPLLSGEPNGKVNVYIVAYESFHVSLNLYDGKDYYEFEWNIDEDDETRPAAFILRTYGKSSFKGTWTMYEVCCINLNETKEDIKSLIDQLEYHIEKIILTQYLLRDCNCRTFVDHLIEFIEKKYNKSNLNRCSNHQLPLGSLDDFLSFESTVNLRGAQEKVLFLVPKLFNSGQINRYNNEGKSKKILRKVFDFTIQSTTQ